MCADLTITTEHGLVYQLTHEGDGLHMTCRADSCLLLDQHIDGCSYPHVGQVMKFLGTTLETPVVTSVHRDG